MPAREIELVTVLGFADLIEDVADHHDRHVRPTWLLPIAVSEASKETYCLSCRAQDYGRVYVWAHSDFDDDDHKLCPLAESLDDFFQGLYKKS